ncbi:hypothetical protein AVL56_06640 [Alteromonas stellipolaris]|uniref:hypothetical protein n=1 Tax=Alteromonas stellipolaris TaxID=233316 RepID=UPI00077064EE|nr:hypothetical protein [Alteromonas stellipolaris]AMJ94019.1 hypothetical protein AVL56_06640 [Alteromonas stellipolaris]
MLKNYYYRFVATILFINLVVLIVAASTGLAYSETLGEPGLWFQRSGALVCLITLCFEIKLMGVISERKMNDKVNVLRIDMAELNPDNNSSVYMIGENGARPASFNDGKLLVEHTEKRATLVNWVLLSNAMIGTLVWAYGDLLF